MSDFDIILRTTNESMKYSIAKSIQPDVDMQKAIVMNTADMQFKFSPGIYKKLHQKIGETPHFGYSNAKQSFWKALQNWITSRYYNKAVINSSTTTTWNNTITSFHGALQMTTKQNDEVLIMCPTYHFFIPILQFKKRKAIQFLLDVKDNRYYIDFDKLQDMIKKNNIKLLLLCNPSNPCGRIWSKEQLQKLCDLVLKYRFYILSDQIYSDSVQLTQQQQSKGLKLADIFTSMLSFEQIYPYLIYISSYTKAFNCSAVPLSYSICFNNQLHKNLCSYRIYSGSVNNCVSYELLQIMYTSQEAKEWKTNVIKYIRKNYELFKSLCKQKLPKLQIYDLQSSYLCVVDFKEYGLAGKKLKQKFTSVNVCPTFMEDCFVTQKQRSMSRLNIALNQKLIVQLVDRLQKMVEVQQETQ